MPDDLVELAARLADPARADDLAVLVRGQRSRRMLSLVGLRRTLTAEAPSLAADSGFDAAWAALSTAAKPALHQVLDTPAMGGWLATATDLIGRDAHRRLAAGHVVAHLGRLARFAAAAVALGGGSTRLSLVLNASARVALPGLGLVARFPLSFAGLPVALTVSAGEARVGDVALQPGHRAEHVLLDVDDEERRRGGAPFLDDADESWVDLLVSAFACLRAALPWAGPELAGVLRTVVPLASPGDGTVVNFTTPVLFGQVATSRPADAAKLGEALLHEMQHGKLYALLDLVELVRRDDRDDLVSPWRPDPRPARGVLHGAYSFAAVAEYYAGRGDEVEAARRAGQVRQALAVLAGTDRLTAAGAAMADVIRARMARLSPAPARDLGVRPTRGDRLAVRTPKSPEEASGERESGVEEVLELLGLAAPAGNGVDDRVVRRDAVLRRLGQLSVLEPEAHAEVDRLIGKLSGHDGLAIVLKGHAAYVRRDFDEAVEHYEAAVTISPGDVDRWTDLAFALRHAGHGGEADVFLHAPRRVATHGLDGRTPRELLRWLAGPG